MLTKWYHDMLVQDTAIADVLLYTVERVSEVAHSFIQLLQGVS